MKAAAIAAAAVARVLLCVFMYNTGTCSSVQCVCVFMSVQRGGGLNYMYIDHLESVFHFSFFPLSGFIYGDLQDLGGPITPVCKGNVDKRYYFS